MYLQANIYHLPVKSESVDLVIADPPFGIGFTGRESTYNRDKSLVTSYVEVDYDISEFAMMSMSEIRRILKPTGTAWIVMGWNNLRYWEHWGNTFFAHQLGHVIWKYQFGVYTRRRPVTSHYHILGFTCHNKKWTWNQQGYDEDVWYIKRPYRRGVEKYPTHLPDEVISNLILRSSNLDDIIYDPFVGSGTTVRVANLLGRTGIGSDLCNNQSFWA